jgi:hypothetical protein
VGQTLGGIESCTFRINDRSGGRLASPAIAAPLCILPVSPLLSLEEDRVRALEFGKGADLTGLYISGIIEI